MLSTPRSTGQTQDGLPGRPREKRRKKPQGKNLKAPMRFLFGRSTVPALGSNVIPLWEEEDLWHQSPGLGFGMGSTRNHNKHTKEL